MSLHIVLLLRTQLAFSICSQYLPLNHQLLNRVTGHELLSLNYSLPNEPENGFRLAQEW